MSRKVTYRRQYTRCGKARCRKCKMGAGHGPYWYAYWSEKGRTISRYVGAQLPEPAAELEPPASPQATTALPARYAAPGDEPVLPHQLPTQVLRIFVLGQFRIDRLQGGAWHTVGDRTCRSRRARALLGCLLSSPGRSMDRERVLRALWPDLDAQVAANRLHGAVHELRHILEPELARPAASRLLRLERDVLALADRSHIWVDAEVFAGLLKQAETCASLWPGCPAPAQQIERLLEEAATLYEGDYLLQEFYSAWAEPRREALRRGWIELLLKLAQLREERDALSEAMEPLNRLLSTDPTDEAAVQRLMLMLSRLERRDEALDVYQRLVTRLRRDDACEPLPATRELYARLKGEDNAGGPASGSLCRPLVGRKREIESMRRLRRSIELAEPGNTHALLLLGEAGIGKTRLAEEFSCETLTLGWAVAWTRVCAAEDTYSPWIELLRLLLRSVPLDSLPRNIYPTPGNRSLLAALLPELRGLLRPPGEMTYPALPPAQERLQLWEAFLALLQSLSETQPLLLVLDDLHSIDGSSREFLAYLTRHLRDQRIFLLATCRDVELAHGSSLPALIADLQREGAVGSLTLQPLAKAQIGSLVSHLPLDSIHSIQRRAAGNPLFAQELARVSGPDRSETELAQQARGVLPAGITAVLDSRLNGLSRDCQALLGKAAVLGSAFEFGQLLLMAHEQCEERLLDLLEEALRSGLLTETGVGSRISYSFRHPLIVGHLRARLPAARRAELRRQALRALLHAPAGHAGSETGTASNHPSSV